MTHTVLLTGASGFIGTHTARCIIAEADCEVIALVRGSDTEAAKRRLLRVWWPWRELVRELGGRIAVLSGDVSQPQLGMDSGAFQKLAGKLTHIIHTAANLRLNGPLEEMRSTNVAGTEHLLELAGVAHEDHGLERFVHVSTAYVAGLRTGDIGEESLTDEAGFSGTYEHSKYEAERLVADASGRLPIAVARPGMVVGDSRTGSVATFNTVYYPLGLYLTGRIRVFPTAPSRRVCFVPVDYVAKALSRLAFDPQARGKTFHLVPPKDSAPTAREFMTFVRDWADTHLGTRLPRALFVPLPAEVVGGLCTRLAFLRIGSPRLLRNLRELAPYFAESKSFLRVNTDAVIGEYRLDWRAYLPELLRFATYHGFLHRSSRTVHEQILKRVAGRTRRITFRDVSRDGVKKHKAGDVCHEMRAAARALRALGVTPGDRVAVVGNNMTRYLIIDAAVGLAGAVSVPLYVTSPADEMRTIVALSGAKVLFIGACTVMKRLREVQFDIPLIWFGRQTGEALPLNVCSWEEFLERGSGATSPESAAVGFGETATIRYSSGTTGKPKGAVFSHAQLKWMGEAVATLPRWRVRNRRVSYVSFLPMNHVVEGILAMYSPYYAPAPVDLWFVEDLAELPRALKHARPTVFFSVPRVYEKLWEQLGRSRLGQRYLDMNDGRAKSIAGGLVRAAFLKRAGLDRCDLFIIGSAPVNIELLERFRELGIEIHNAYGLTEAPLVTINRLGANRIGTVGEPMPQTEIRIDKQGEVLVHGPHVATRYFGSGGRALMTDGWLRTGDTGHLTSDGRLVLTGRLSDVIITSYGKNIHPEPVEAVLKTIPGVGEAMLVGEGRPFCAAILLVDPTQWSFQTDEGIKRAMRDLERHLPAPARPKRWAILSNDLTIETGDLTPNYKVRRKAVLARYAHVIASLYREGSVPNDVLSMGEQELHA